MFIKLGGSACPLRCFVRLIWSACRVDGGVIFACVVYRWIDGGAAFVGNLIADGQIITELCLYDESENDGSAADNETENACDSGL